MRIKAKITPKEKTLRRITNQEFSKNKTVFYKSEYFDRMLHGSWRVDMNFKMITRITYDYYLND
jgi:hypothetical protein